MTDKTFRDLWTAAQAAQDAESLISGCTGLDTSLPIIREQLTRLWSVAHDDFRDLLAAFGMRQTELSVRFCIPLRTVQSWVGHTRVCPLYLRLMIAEAVGYINLRS